MIAFFNMKGGSGKTTSAVNVSDALSTRGRTTLLVDLCSQGDSTKHLVYVPGGEYNPFSDELDPIEITDTFSFLPANPRYLTRYELDNKPLSFNRYIQGRGEAVIFDCPPVMGWVATAALLASDTIVVPIAPSYLSVEAIDVIEMLLSEAAAGSDAVKAPDIWVLITQYDSRRRIDRAIRHALDASSRNVFATEIPFNTELTIAPGAGMTIFGYAPRSRGAASYELLVKEMMERGIA